MNIIPNYQLRSFNNLNSRVNNQQLQTNPSFGIKQYVVPTAVITSVAASALAALVSAKLNLEKTEIKIPPRKEFEQMLENDDMPKYNKEEWLNAYDTDAKNTVAFYNLEDKEGNRYRDTNYITIWKGQELHKHPELVKLVVDTEDEQGLRVFSFDEAESIVDFATYYPNGLVKMLNMNNEYGNLRFNDCEDYVAAEVFEKFPEEAEKYAMAKDDMGNYRFNGKDIHDIVKAKMLEKSLQKDSDDRNGGYINRINNINAIINARLQGYIKPEDIDKILNFKRNDGSYIFNRLPDLITIKKYLDEPKLFTEICNTKTPNRYKYVRNPDFVSLIPGFKFYPEETKHLLQMSSSDNESRFSESDIVGTELQAQKLYKAAPKTFMSLASLRKGKFRMDGYRFDIYEICKLMKSIGNKEKIEDISEFGKEDMQTIYALSRIQVRNKHNNFIYLDIDDICKLFSIKKFMKD